MSRKTYRTSIMKSKFLNDPTQGVELKITQPPCLYKVKIIHSSLRKRNAPSIDAPVTGIISDEGIYIICNEQDGWGQLQDGSWIMLQYTQKWDKNL